MRNTIRKVTIDVLVLITICHVSLYPKAGPVDAQMITVSTAMPNVTGFPETFAAHLAKAGYEPIDFWIFIGSS